MDQTIRTCIGQVNTLSGYSLANNSRMDFRQWLQAELGMRKMSQSALSRLSKVPQPTIQRILSGETPDPRGSTTTKIRRALGDTPNTTMGPDIRGSVPLISSVQAGEYMEVIDNLQPGEGERIDTTLPVKRYTYALVVDGDSMEPVLPEGSILIVEPDMDARHGDFVIIRNGDGGATVKRLVKDGADWYLKPENPRYPVKPLPSDAVFCGVVRGMELRFR